MPGEDVESCWSMTSLSTKREDHTNRVFGEQFHEHLLHQKNASTLRLEVFFFQDGKLIDA